MIASDIGRKFCKHKNLKRKMMTANRKYILLVGMQLVIASLYRTVECSHQKRSVGLKTLLVNEPLNLREYRDKNSAKVTSETQLLLTDARDLAESPDQSTDGEEKTAGLLTRIGSSIKNAIAPAQSYVQLVNRYHKWFQNYKAFQKISKVKIPDAYEILKIEYTKVEKLMIDEELERHQQEQQDRQQQLQEQQNQQRPEEDAEELDPEELASSEVKQPSEQKLKKKIENVDFVFKVLKLVIDRLEVILQKMEESEGVEVNVEGDPTLGEAVDQEKVQQAMERVKKSVVNSAKGLLSGELAIIARTAAFNGLAQIMAAKPDTGDALDHLRPIIFLIGSATTPLAVSYLMSVEFRAGLAVANAINPLSHIMDTIKNRKNQGESVTTPNPK